MESRARVENTIGDLRGKKEFEILRNLVEEYFRTGVLSGSGSALRVALGEGAAKENVAEKKISEEVSTEVQGLKMIEKYAKYKDGAKVLDEVSVYMRAGIGLSDVEWYEVSHLVSLLSGLEEEGNISFWGKLLGTKSDYYIAERSLETVVNRGASSSTYFAFPIHGSRKWFQLGKMRHAHLAVVQNTQKILTGDPEAEVRSLLHFPGREKHFLRALIGFITADTHACPVGMYTQQDTSVTLDPDYETHPLNELSDWNLFKTHLLQNPQQEEDEDEEEEARIVRPLDPSNVWCIRELSMESLELLRNSRWPGSVTVAKAGKGCGTIYIGFGLRYIPGGGFALEALQSPPPPLQYETPHLQEQMPPLPSTDSDQEE